jgi:hypothetical protein
MDMHRVARRGILGIAYFLAMCTHAPCWAFVSIVPQCGRICIQKVQNSCSLPSDLIPKYNGKLAYSFKPRRFNSATFDAGYYSRTYQFRNRHKSPGDFSTEISAGQGSGGGGINRLFRRRGDSGGDEGDDDITEREVSALLKKFGLSTSDVGNKWGEIAQSLSAEKLLRFLKSYSNLLNRKLIDTWPAWRDKMLADPDFVYKLLIEQIVGLGLVMSGTIASRGKDLLKELDFFLTDCSVGEIMLH